MSEIIPGTDLVVVTTDLRRASRGALVVEIYRGDTDDELLHPRMGNGGSYGIPRAKAEPFLRALKEALES